MRQTCDSGGQFSTETNLRGFSREGNETQIYFKNPHSKIIINQSESQHSAKHDDIKFPCY